MHLSQNTRENEITFRKDPPNWGTGTQHRELPYLPWALLKKNYKAIIHLSAITLALFTIYSLFPHDFKFLCYKLCDFIPYT